MGISAYKNASSLLLRILTRPQEANAGNDQHEKPEVEKARVLRQGYDDSDKADEDFMQIIPFRFPESAQDTSLVVTIPQIHAHEVDGKQPQHQCSAGEEQPILALRGWQDGKQQETQLI